MRLLTVLELEVLPRETSLNLLITREVDHMVEIITMELISMVDMAKEAHLDGRIVKEKVDTITDHTIKVHHHAPRPSPETSSPSWRTSESWLSSPSWPVAPSSALDTSP